MIFGKAIDKAIYENLKKSKKNILIGLGVSYENKPFYKNFPNQVIETPVSELSFTGMAVGLGTQGYRALVDHGRIEFSILAFDQILTQAARWNFMFGGDYNCCPTFKIFIGRQWGNGPQHTGTYHSIFLQSLGMNIYIPSTPYEAYIHVKAQSENNHPTTILEHRWLYLNNQTFKIPKKIKIHQGSYINSKQKKNLIITYGDGFSESLLARKTLKKNNIDVAVLSLSYFPKNKRISTKLLKFVKNFDNIFYVDTSPFDFGLLNGFSGILNTQKYKKFNEYKISPPFMPCPTSPKLSKNYYPNRNTIAKKIGIILQNKKVHSLEKMSFYQIHTVTEINLDPLLKDVRYIY